MSSDEGAALRRIERKLDAVMAHLGLAEAAGDAMSAEARDLADRGQTIAAIKQHRTDTGAGLAEAKAAVERYLLRG